MHSTSIHITAVVVRWTTSTGREQKGVATTWLATKKPKGKRRTTGFLGCFFHKALLSSGGGGLINFRPHEWGGGSLLERGLILNL